MRDLLQSSPMKFASAPRAPPSSTARLLEISEASTYWGCAPPKNCRTGDVLDEEQVEVERKEDVLNALTQIASKFRTRVGESLETVEKHDTPLAEATTSSLEALKAYSMGWKVVASTGGGAAIPFFKHALEIDPKFAVAYASLGLM